LKNFDYSKILDSKFSSSVLSLISEIYEHKGKQNLFLVQKTDSLESLVSIAKVQSTEASNRIEGIVTTEKRINEIMQEKTMPKTRDEEEIMGYRDVLKTIHENYEHIKVSPNFILQLHRDLYQYSTGQWAGKFKNTDNLIQEEDSLGNKRIKFAPLEAYLTPDAMEKVCIEYANAKNKLQVEPLILIPIFILDFLCIHPFNDGNGRMSRLLTLLLLYQNDFVVGKYISLEKIIATTKEDYYDVLERSSYAWHENQNDPMHFVEYILKIILNAYKQFEERVITVESFKLSKAEQIKNVFITKLGKISKKEIKALLPHISEAMIEMTLKSLLDEGFIEKIGAGKNTNYIKTN
jgi:Fic family protein